MLTIQNKIHTMKMTKHNMAKGFTLVELLVVIAIIAALAALSTPVVLKQQKKAAAT
ncbi:MAG: prepilin-type N-terminal cleavage/methylation domain-containing protein, partial [Akkermansiaceae bacterium]